MIKELAVPRQNAAHVVLAGFLYVIGGDDEQDESLSSVEYYVPLTNEWKAATPMKRKRSFAIAHALNGFIFVLGGMAIRENIQSIERYDPRENSWTEVRLNNLIRLESIDIVRYLLMRIFSSFKFLAVIRPSPSNTRAFIWLRCRRLAISRRWHRLWTQCGEHFSENKRPFRCGGKIGQSSGSLLQIPPIQILKCVFIFFENLYSQLVSGISIVLD